MRKRIILFISVLLTALSCVFAVAAAEARIPAGAVTYKGHSYYLYKQAVTWTKAKQMCEKVGGHLVTITNAAENKLVCKLAENAQKSDYCVWIGLYNSNYPDINSKFKWVTGEKYKYDRAYVLEAIQRFVYLKQRDTSYDPDPGFQEGDWFGAYMRSDKYFYVCEWEPAQLSVSKPKITGITQNKSNTVTLEWTGGKNAKFFEIYRKSGIIGIYVKIGTTKEYSYTDKTVKKGKVYSYIVKAVNRTNSASSSAVKAYPMAKPTSVKVKSAEGKKVTVSWKKVSGAKKYLVYWKGPDDTEYKQIKSVKTTKTTIAMPEASGTYKFLVRPAVGSFIGIPSKAASFKYENTVYRAIILVFSYFGTDAYLSSAGSMSSGMVNTLKNLDATPYQITSLFDPSVDEIKAAFCNVFGQADSDDVTLLYIYGHGLEGATNPADHGAILIAHGTENNVGLHPEEFRAELDKYQGKKVILLETCYSGVMIGKGKSASTKREKVLKAQTSFINAFRGSNRGDHDLAGPGYYVLTASNGEQESWYHFFTTYLMNGLGWENSAKTQLYADSNGDHKVTFNEIYKYVRKQVDQEWADAMAEVQTVQVYPENCQIAFFGRTE